jgi:molecular chaperone DnaJ
MAAGGDFYTVLGVGKEASEKEIKAAFRQLAHEFHPDRVGDDSAKIERFKMVREAYETLSDPARRAAYDRRNERRSGNRPFYGTHWQHAGTPSEGGVGNRHTAKAGNNIDLEDIFNDFGGVDLGMGRDKRASRDAPPPTSGPRPRARQWNPMHDFKTAAENDTWPGAGEGSGPAGPGQAPGSAGRPPGFGFTDGGWSSGSAHARSNATGAPRPASSGPAEPGADIHVNVKLASTLLGIGGLVTVEYDRNVRADDQRSLVSIRELHDLRVPPDIRDGDTLRVEKFGHAGPGGGPYGDLVATVAIVGVGPRMKMPKAEAPAAGDVVVVDVPFTDAILGGRVEVQTPQGRVRVAIPAGTSSGARFRIKGRGRPDAAGQAGDLFAEVRVTVPRELDAESRGLIERFAELNPVVTSGE